MRKRLLTSGGLCVAVGAVWLALSPSPGFAQVYQRIAPREPQAAPAPVVSAPAAPAAAPAPGTVVVTALRGVSFLPTLSALRTTGSPGADGGSAGVSVAGLPLLDAPGFIDQVKPFIGRPLTLADVQTITRLTTAWYRAHGRPFVSIVAPPQNLGGGVLQLVVTEYRLGAVKVAGNRWFSSELLRRESGLEPGQTLTLAGVQGDLDRLNANPFRSVNTVFQPGAAPGVTDVVLQTQDRLPVRVYAGFDNAGAANLGRGEWSVGVVWGNALGLDQTLSYQFTRGVSGRYDAHALSWTAPLPWRDRLQVFGSYATETPDIGGIFGETGTSGQASLRYVHILPTVAFSPSLALTQDLQIGYDLKSTNNDLEFGGFQVFSTQARIGQVPIIYDAALTDAHGQTTLQNQLVVSFGSDGALTLQAIVPGAKPDYVYDRLSVTRTTFVSAGPAKGFSWTVRATGQITDSNLLYSEQLGLGGMDSVRGYYTDTVLGSRGVLVSQEVRTPAFALVDVAHLSAPVRDQTQLGVFWDYGHVQQVQAIPNGVNAATLSSVGVDLHTTFDRFVDLKFDVGDELRAAPRASRHGAFVDVSLVVGF